MRQTFISQMEEQSIPLEGFTLIESLVAMLILLATLGGLLPVFMSARLASIDNQIKTGAIAVAQTGLEEIRQTPLDLLPGFKAPTEETQTVQYMGKTYSKVTTFCPLSFDDDTDDSNDVPSIHCEGNKPDDVSKKDIRIAVSHNDRNILVIDTVYTNLQ